jgi:hypothetical protein
VSLKSTRLLLEAKVVNICEINKKIKINETIKEGIIFNLY